MNLYAATAIVRTKDQGEIISIPIAAHNPEQMELTVRTALDMRFEDYTAEIQGAPFPKRILDGFMVSYYAEYWSRAMTLALDMNRKAGKDMENIYFSQLGISSGGVRLMMIKDKTIVGTYLVPISMINGDKTVDEWYSEYLQRDSKWHTQDS